MPASRMKPGSTQRDADAAAVEVDPQRAGEAAQAELRGVIERIPGRADLAGRGGDEHELAAAAREHPGQQRVGQGDRRAQVDGQRTVDLLARERVEPGRGGQRGVGDEHVDLARLARRGARPATRRSGPRRAPARRALRPAPSSTSARRRSGSACRRGRRARVRSRRPMPPVAPVSRMVEPEIAHLLRAYDNAGDRAVRPDGRRQDRDRASRSPSCCARAGEVPVAVSADALQVYAGLETLTGVAGARASRPCWSTAWCRSCRCDESFSVGQYAQLAHARDRRAARGAAGARSSSAAPGSTCARR